MDIKENFYINLQKLREEQLDEVSVRTLTSYVKKAKISKDKEKNKEYKHMEKASDAMDKSDSRSNTPRGWQAQIKDGKKYEKHADAAAEAADKQRRRVSGIKLAKSKLTATRTKRGNGDIAPWVRAGVNEEQLDELRKPKDIDKLKKHMGKAARAREDAMMRDTYNPAYNDETKARRDALRYKTPEARKKAEEAGENRKSAASKMVKIQRVADKLERKKEKLEEVKASTAINAFRQRTSRANDFYSEPNDQDKADKTLAIIKKKYGENSKVAAGAEHGVEIDTKGRKGNRGSSGDYLSAKQDVYSKFSRPKSKKGTKERKEYMKMNKGRFAKKK